MPGYRTVLVGTDGSTSSLSAVERAAGFTARDGAALVIACAYRPLSGPDLARAADELGPEAHKVAGATPAEDTLAEAAGRAKAAGAGDVQTVARDGDPSDVLVALSSECAADLVVVGNRGLNSLTGRLLGSVPADVAHRVTCDVLIVHTTRGR